MRDDGNRVTIKRDFPRRVRPGLVTLSRPSLQPIALKQDKRLRHVLALVHKSRKAEGFDSMAVNCGQNLVIKALPLFYKSSV